MEINTLLNNEELLYHNLIDHFVYTTICNKHEYMLYVPLLSLQTWPQLQHSSPPWLLSRPEVRTLIDAPSIFIHLLRYVKSLSMFCLSWIAWASTIQSTQPSCLRHLLIFHVGFPCLSSVFGHNMCHSLLRHCGINFISALGSRQLLQLYISMDLLLLHIECNYN